MHRANRKLFRSRSPVGESEAHSSLRTPFLSGSEPTALLFPVRATSSQYTIDECSPHERKAPEVISPLPEKLQARQGQARPIFPGGVCCSPSISAAVQQFGKIVLGVFCGNGGKHQKL